MGFDDEVEKLEKIREMLELTGAVFLFLPNCFSLFVKGVAQGFF